MSANSSDENRLPVHSQHAKMNIMLFQGQRGWPDGGTRLIAHD
jgi:hypothetical protein